MHLHQLLELLLELAITAGKQRKSTKSAESEMAPDAGLVMALKLLA
jgi:hypothetical protein